MSNSPTETVASTEIMPGEKYYLVTTNSNNSDVSEMCLTSTGRSGSRRRLNFLPCIEKNGLLPYDFNKDIASSMGLEQDFQLFTISGDMDQKIYHIKGDTGKCLDPTEWLTANQGDDLNDLTADVKSSDCSNEEQLVDTGGGAIGDSWQLQADGKLMNTHSGYNGKGNVRGCLQIKSTREAYDLNGWEMTMVPCDVATSKFKFVHQTDMEFQPKTRMIRATNYGNAEFPNWCLNHSTESGTLRIQPCIPGWKSERNKKIPVDAAQGTGPVHLDQDRLSFAFTPNRVLRDVGNRCVGLETYGYIPPTAFIQPRTKLDDSCKDPDNKAIHWKIDPQGKLRNTETGDKSFATVENTERPSKQNIEVVDQCLDIHQPDLTKYVRDTVVKPCTEATTTFEIITKEAYDATHPSPQQVAQEAQEEKEEQEAIEKVESENKMKMYMYIGLGVVAVLILFLIMRKRGSSDDEYDDEGYDDEGYENDSYADREGQSYDSGAQSHGYSSQGYPPAQGYSYPSVQGYGAPSYGSPPGQGYGPPSHGYPPSPGYGAPAGRGYGPPPAEQWYGPSAGYGHAPPAGQGYGPPERRGRSDHEGGGNNLFRSRVPRTKFPYVNLRKYIKQWPYW